MPHVLQVLSLLGCMALVAGCGAEPSPAAPADAGSTAAIKEEPKPAPVPAWDASTSIGDIVAVRPETARLFELLDIDYCCGGKQTLAAAAQEKGLKVDRLLGTLRTIGGSATVESQRSWADAPLDELVAHIVDTYHVRLRTELPRLEELVTTVVEVHGDEHPELIEVGTLFATLHKDLPPHLELEETKVFPAILATPAGDQAATRRLLEEMSHDHDTVGGALHRIRELTGGYKPPADACMLYTQMLSGLADLERDLHAHVHLENNVLLPRALKALKGS